MKSSAPRMSVAVMVDAERVVCSSVLVRLATETAAVKRAGMARRTRSGADSRSMVEWRRSN